MYITDVVKHSGNCAMYKLKDFLNILKKVYKETDTDFLDYGKKLNTELQNTLKANIDSIHLDKFKLKEIVRYMCTILSFDMNHEKNFDNKGLRLLVISWFSIFLATPKIEFLGD